MRTEQATNKQRGVLSAAIVAVALASTSPAGADTLKYDGPGFFPYSGSFTITDSSPLRSPVSVKAGAFAMIDTSGTTLPAGTSFMAWCVDIYHFISPSTSYTRVDGADFYSSAPYKATDVERLASYVFDNGLLTNNLESAAFQLAVWEIVNDGAGTGSYDVDGGDFRVTSGDTGVRDQANDWLGVVNAGTYGIGQRLSVWQQDYPGTTQDLAVFAPVPEPSTYAMLLGGLVLLGFAGRRRTSQAA